MENENSIGQLPRKESNRQDMTLRENRKLDGPETRPGNYAAGNLQRSRTKADETNYSEEDMRPSSFRTTAKIYKKKKKKDNAHSIVANWDSVKDKGYKEEGSVDPANTKVEAIESSNTQTNDKCSNSEKQSCYGMAEEIMELYDFRQMDKQLFLYYEMEGYWRMIKESEANREIRNIIPLNLRGKVSKNSLYEIYEWLRIRAEEGDDDLRERKYYIILHNAEYCLMQSCD